MRIQVLKVIGVPWFEPDSGQASIELETAEGKRFTCFCECGEASIAPGRVLQIETFYWLSGDENTDEMLKANPRCVKEIEHCGNWDYFLRGQIIDIEGHTAIVDCGGVFFPIDNFGADRRAIGEWIGLRVERLEAELV